MENKPAITYHPACYLCRKNKGHSVDGMEKSWLCVPHLQERLEILQDENKRIRGLLWRINSLSRAIVNRGNDNSPHTTYGKLKKVVAEVDSALRREEVK